ncbi:unnamed protein product, partial [Brassica oleracea var. botrytis]
SKAERIIPHFASLPSNLPKPLSFIILPSPQANSSQFITMSNSIHRRRVPTPVGNGGRSLRTKRTASRYVSDQHGSKYTNQVFERSFSESNLNRRRDGDGNCMRQPSPVMSGLPTGESDPIVYLPRIRSEVMASSPSLLGFSSPSSPFPTNQEGNKRETRKVVINVAVEGSPGPVRTMVKLSCNVEETIKLVLENYRKEGRTPKLDQGAAFELHQSHFSIQCLDKREIIGEIGSRSFYLRKRDHETGVAFAGISPVRTSLISSSNLLESCIAQFIGKILRRTRKLWNILSSKVSTFSWGCLVRFLSQHRKFKEAVTSYIEMNNSGVPPSSHAITSVLRACGKIESVVDGNSVHAQAVKSGLCGCVYVQTGLVGLYSRLGYIDMAKKAFDEIGEKNTVSWNSLLHGYLESGDLEEARRVFDDIPEKDVVSWNLIISSYAKRGDMSDARSLFLAMPLKSSASWNILIGGYVNCGETKLARTSFDAMPDKSSVSWITMISGYTKSGDVESAEELFRQMFKKDKLVYDAMIACYAQNGKPKDALKLFSQMLEANSGVGLQPDEITLSSVVSASSQLGDTSFGTWVESYITEHRIQMDDLLSTSLIDLYMKGGEFDKAFKLFNGLNKKDTVSYSAMITGCGINGLAAEANRLFQEMIEKNILSNQVTFTGLLSACSHSGLVQDGYQCFDLMKKYNVEPSADHYGIMVDMLGRAGRLEEAYEVINGMPMKPNAGVWGALLLASGLHKSVEFGEIACRYCVELESDPSGYLSHLANIYTSVGRWDDARNVRAKMEEKKLRKTLGCSWVEASNH